MSQIAVIQKGTSITEKDTVEGYIPVIAGGKEPAYYHNVANREANVITGSASGAYAGFLNYWEQPIFASDCNTIISKDEKNISTKLIFEFLKSIQSVFYSLQRGQGQPHVYASDIEAIKIPLPPKAIQEKIISEIDTVEQKEKAGKEKVKNLRDNISTIINRVSGTQTKLKIITSKIGSGATPRGGNASYQRSGINFIRSQNIYDYGFVEEGLAFIGDEQAEKLSNVTVEENDILFNITGSIARCCIVPKEYLPARVSQHVSIIRANDKVLPKYIQMILVSAEYKNQLLQISEGATSRQAITKQQLEEFKVPVPTLSKQQEIVDQILKIENEIVQIESELTTIDTQKKQILKKYLE